MMGVILVAGKGRRLKEGLPKCLNIVGSKTILERQLSSLRRLGIEKLVCVVGYKSDQVKQAVREFWNTQVRFVENPRYEATNTIFSLHLATKFLNDDVIYMNGDVVFRSDLLDRLVGEEGDGVLGIVRKQCGDEEVKVIVQDRRIIKIGKKIPPAECYGEFIGVALFRKSILDLLSESLRNLVQEQGLVSEYFEVSLNEIKDEVVLKAVDITDIPCIEIDFPEDLWHAQKNYMDFEEIG